MKNGKWHVFISLVLSAFLVFSTAGADLQPSLEAPKLMGNVLTLSPEAAAGPGAWYLGLDPKKVDKKKPPVVFVHGIHGHAQDWWGSTRYYGVNDAYELAYVKGYRTSFVHLYDEKVGAQDQHKNGEILAKLLEKIYKHYKQKVNIVAHSKGGVDAQAALVYSDAHQYVNKVITLASPHEGCYLADLAYSWYAGWIAELIGMRDEGSYALQTGVMSDYREETDRTEEIKKTPYYTVSGTHWGPYPSVLWLGGLYLSLYGESDGMITDDSTRLSYGTHLGVLNADHDSIRKGSIIFPVIDQVLRSDKVEPVTVVERENIEENITEEVMEQYVNGGSLRADESLTRKIEIDSSIKEAGFNIMTKSDDVNVVLTSPSGKKYTKQSGEYLTYTGAGIFAGSAIQHFKVKNPEVGPWNLFIRSKKDDAFLLNSLFTGIPTYTLNVPQTSARNEIPIQIAVNTPSNVDPESLRIRTRIVNRGGPDLLINSAQQECKLFGNSKGIYKGHIQGVTQAGMYNVTLEIRGKTKDGHNYQRTVIQSVNVGNKKYK